MAMKYNACAYRNNKPYKFISVLANNKEEALIKAQAKFVELGVQFDYVTVS